MPMLYLVVPLHFKVDYFFPPVSLCCNIFSSAQDFFAPQQVRAPTVFMCRMIFHDYGKSVAAKILKELRSAASSNTKLLIIDQVFISPLSLSQIFIIFTADCSICVPQRNNTVPDE